MDSPTELSDYSLRTFTVRKTPDGKTLTIRTAVHHDATDADVDEYAAGAEKIVLEQAAVFGEFPEFDAGTYTFLGDYLPWGGGDGMEHRNSTVVAAPVVAFARRWRRACSAPSRTSSSTRGTSSASARNRSSHSISRKRTCRASSGSPKASRSTTEL